MNIFMRLFLAVNQGVCLILTGQNDLTISGYSYYQKVVHGKPLLNNIVNTLFFWQDDHCAGAMRWEYRNAARQVKRLQKAYESAIE